MSLVRRIALIYLYYIFLRYVPRQDARNSTNQCTDFVITGILNSIIVLLQRRFQLDPGREGVVFSPATSFNPHNLWPLTFIWLNNYIHNFSSHHNLESILVQKLQYKNALKKQYVTFTVLSSPALKVTFLHTSRYTLFPEQLLQKEYISHGRSFNIPQQDGEQQFSKTDKLVSSHPNTIHTGHLTSSIQPDRRTAVQRDAARLERSVQPCDRLTGRGSTGSQRVYRCGLARFLALQRKGFRPATGTNPT
jgi:hypothetical protein